MRDLSHFHWLVTAVHKLPQMAKDEHAEQVLDFVYGHLASPVRAAFEKLAIAKGWSTERFRQWADGRVWHDEP